VKRAALLVAGLTAGCAGIVAPPPGAPERAHAARTYSASLRVSLRSPTLRGGARALVAFARPDSLRLEVPGPTGVRCIAVARGVSLVAAFPAERAVWRGAATADEMASLLGVRLTPAELMDVLVGAGGPRLRDYRASWGSALPRRIEATLDDGTRLTATVESADLEPDLPNAAFDEPGSPEWRVVDADEARRLLGIR
jgi:hypothetical protein